MSTNKAAAFMVAGIQVLAILMVVSLVPVSPVQAATLPAQITSNWVINTTVSYWGGSCEIIDAAIIIDAGGSLELHRSTLTFTSNTVLSGIQVNQNGELKTEDATLKEGNANGWGWNWDFGSKGMIKGTTITGIRNGNGFMAVYTAGVTFDGNDISASDAGMLIGDGTTPVTPVIVNNTFHDIDAWAIVIQASSPTVTGNTFSNNNGAGGLWGAVTVAGGAPTFSGNTFNGNGGAGLVVAGTNNLKIYDCVFQNPNDDIHVEGYDAVGQSAASSNLQSFNSVISKVAINTFLAAGAPSEGKATFKPFNNVDVLVKKASTGAPIDGATVEIDARDGTKLVTGLTTGHDGMVRSIDVPEYSMEHKGGATDQTTKADYFPHAVWGSATINGNDVRTNTTVNIDTNHMLINVSIDDIPPALKVTSPLTGFMTNDTGIYVEGTTEPTAYLTVKGNPTTVNTDGTFSKSLGLTEGKNDIPVTATDTSGNSRTVSITVFRDTFAPVVKIANPANGTTIGIADPYVTGIAEFGSALTINGKIVPVAKGGSFNTTLHLNEGLNTIVAIDRDLVGNQGTSTVEVFLDTQAPTITVSEPSDNKKTKTEDLTIRGSTENHAFLTVNGNQVVLQGILFQTTIKLQEGANNIVIRSSDEVGNTNTKILTVTLDTIAPTLTLTSPQDYSSTNADSIVVTGTTESGATVKINGQIADNIGGSFSKEIKLGTSQNKISVEVLDSVGNSVVQDLHVIKDTIPPELTIQAPADGAVLNEQTRGKCEIRGRTEAGATVYVNGERVGVAGTNFQAFVYLAEGNNSIVITAYDPAGNAETAELFVTFDNGVKGTVVTPSNQMNTTADFVMATGFVEPGTSVMINGAKVTVSAEGGFTQRVPIAKGANTLTFTMTDKAGNQLIITRYVNGIGGGKNPSSSALPLNALFGVLVLVFVIAIVIVLMSGKPKKQSIADALPGQEPPPPSFQGVPPPPNFGAGYTPPPPDFSSGGVAPPGYGYAQQPAYDQSYGQGYEQQTYEGTAAAVEQQPVTEAPTELVDTQPEPVDTQGEPVKVPEPVDEEEDMKPKPAPLPEDMPKVTMKFNDLPSSDQIAESAKARKSEAWKKDEKKKDVLDEILESK
jgi:parallel beta-helix repeat protein